VADVPLVEGVSFDADGAGVADCFCGKAEGVVCLVAGAGAALFVAEGFVRGAATAPCFAV